MDKIISILIDYESINGAAGLKTFDTGFSR